MKKIIILLLISILFFNCVSSRGCSTRATNYNAAIIR